MYLNGHIDTVLSANFSPLLFMPQEAEYQQTSNRMLSGSCTVCAASSTRSYRHMSAGFTWSQVDQHNDRSANPMTPHLGPGVDGGLESRLLVPRPLRLAGQQVRPWHVVAPQRLLPESNIQILFTSFW